MDFFDAVIKRGMYGLRTSVKSAHVYAFPTRNSPTRLVNLVRVEMATRLGKTTSFGYPYIRNSGDPCVSTRALENPEAEIA